MSKSSTSIESIQDKALGFQKQVLSSCKGSESYTGIIQEHIAYSKVRKAKFEAENSDPDKEIKYTHGLTGASMNKINRAKSENAKRQEQIKTVECDPRLKGLYDLIATVKNFNEFLAEHYETFGISAETEKEAYNLYKHTEAVKLSCKRFFLSEDEKTMLFIERINSTSVTFFINREITVDKFRFETDEEYAQRIVDTNEPQKRGTVKYSATKNVTEQFKAYYIDNFAELKKRALLALPKFVDTSIW